MIRKCRTSLEKIRLCTERCRLCIAETERASCKQKGFPMRLVCSLTIRWKMWLVLLRTQGRITNAPAAGKYTANECETRKNFWQNTKMQRSLSKTVEAGAGHPYTYLSRHKTANMILQQMLPDIVKKCRRAKVRQHEKYKEERRGIKHEQSSSCILEWNRKHKRSWQIK